MAYKYFIFPTVTSHKTGGLLQIRIYTTIKYTCKILPLSCYEGKEEEYRCIFIQSEHGRGTKVGGQRHASVDLSPLKRPGTLFTGGWMGPRAGVESVKKRKSLARPLFDSELSTSIESLYRLPYPRPP